MAFLTQQIFYIIHETTISSKILALLHVFLYKVCWNISHFKNITICVYRPLCKVTGILVTLLRCFTFLDSISEYNTICNFKIFHCVASGLLHVEAQTWRNNNSQFANLWIRLKFTIHENSSMMVLIRKRAFQFKSLPNK